MRARRSLNARAGAARMGRNIYNPARAYRTRFL